MAVIGRPVLRRGARLPPVFGVSAAAPPGPDLSNITPITTTDWIANPNVVIAGGVATVTAANNQSLFATVAGGALAATAIAQLTTGVAKTVTITVTSYTLGNIRARLRQGVQVTLTDNGDGTFSGSVTPGSSVVEQQAISILTSSASSTYVISKVAIV